MIKPRTARAYDFPTRLKASRVNLGTRKVPLCLAPRAIDDVGLVLFLILKDTHRALHWLCLCYLQCIIKRLVSLALRLDRDHSTLDYVRVLHRILYHTFTLEFFFRQERLMLDRLWLDVDADVL